ncbi:TIGR03943 family protein [Paenibacillus melissococcoides]|uniref:TIGR03943 family protein n=1 Tax=Paenibacillus melissococcoides TaxID=2912268 RepID=A0ABM9FXI1_9BACL|nr:TIGR03943 family protein [Paenibacillus melissococcoides]CAH8243913.1 TIGR03943 family protein [Paenibacillus melissococcoides]CAH8704223.1 TIGR03943 family protein [Paenibacillus melissococcoides]CAH8706995.1 TIGR03943 family protein [Paenibacillus melissococcoides]
MSLRKRPWRQALVYLLQSVIMFAWSLFILSLFWQDKVQYYIAPRMEIWVQWGTAALYVLAAFQLYRALILFFSPEEEAGHADCGCDHHPGGFRIGRQAGWSLVFVLPLAAAALLPVSPLGSAMAEKKGVQYSIAQERTGGPERVRMPGTAGRSSGALAEGMSSPELPLVMVDEPGATPQEAGEPEAGGQAAEQEEEMLWDGRFPYDRYTLIYANHAAKLIDEQEIKIPEKLFIETITTLDLYKEQFQGKKITLRGFVHRDEGMGQNRFAVVRFALECCAADAFPYGIMTEVPAAARFADDSWVEVTGTLSKLKLDEDTEVMKLEAENGGIRLIEAPPDPYVYMNADFYFDKK